MLKGQINLAIRDSEGKIIPWKKRNRDRANARARERMAEKKAIDPEKIKLDRRKWFIKAKFGLTPELREKLIVLQEFKCAICGINLDKDSSNWAIDHCHKGNFVRGMLCKPCNSGLGLFKDSPEVLLAAAKYLKQTSDIRNEPSIEDFIIATRLLEKTNAFGGV